MVNPWLEAQRIRAAHLTPLPESPSTKTLNAACIAIANDVITLLQAHDTGRPARCWYTAQFTSGRVAGIWANTELEARLELQIWHGHEIVWIARDPDCEILNRYKESVQVQHQHEALFEITDKPAAYPAATNVPQRPVAQPTLFDLIGA